MRRSHSHAGFWAVVRAARHRPFTLRGLGLELRRRIPLAGMSWALSQFIKLSEASRRRVSYLSLDLRSRTSPKRRRELEDRIAPLVERLGFRRRKTPFRYPGMSFEKSFDGKAGSLADWPRILRAFDIAPALRGTARALPGTREPLPRVCRRMFREGWRGTDLGSRGPARRFRCILPWTLSTDVYWTREGVSLVLALESSKRVRDADVRTLQRSGFLDRIAGELALRGLRSGVKEALQEIWKGQPSPLTIFFGRDRIPPGRLLEAVDGLRDWKPTGEKGRGS